MENNDLDLRMRWEQAKKEGTLGGCGLCGNLTFEEIDRVKLSQEECIRLAGVPAKVDRWQIRYIINTIEMLTKEISVLRNLITERKVNSENV